METTLIKEISGLDWPTFPKTNVSKLKQRESLNPDLLVGIEVEAEKFTGYKSQTPHHFSDIWRQETDGSLRNNGVEFISNPIPVAVVRDALELLFSSQKSKLDFSKRTSIHVHVDVTNTQYQHVINLICLYICFESVLFRYAGDFRRKSIFCVPLKETTLILKHQMITDTAFIMNGRTWTKYTAMNLLPVATQGTVEFRHLQGTDDVKYICTWIEILARIKKYSTQYTYEELSEKLFSLVTSSQYYQLAVDIFGDLVNTLFPNGDYSIKEFDSSLKFLKAQFVPSSIMQKNVSIKKYFGFDTSIKKPLDLQDVLFVEATTLGNF